MSNPRKYRRTVKSSQQSINYLATRLSGSQPQNRFKSCWNSFVSFFIFSSSCGSWVWQNICALVVWLGENLFGFIGLYVLLSFASGHLIGAGYLCKHKILLPYVKELKECYIAFIGLSSPNISKIITAIGKQTVDIINAVKK